MGGLATVSWLTREMPPADYGEFALALTLALLFSQLLFASASQPCLRYFGTACDSGQARLFASALAKHIAAPSLIAASAAALAFGFLSFLHPHLAAVGALTIAFAWVSGMNTIGDGLQNSTRQRKSAAAHQFATYSLRLLAAVLLFVLWPAGSLTAMTAFFGAGLIVLTSQGFWFRVFLRPRAMDNHPGAVEPCENWRIRLREYGSPFLSWTAICWLQNAMDRWALQFFHGKVEVGIYAVSYQLGYAPLILLAASLNGLVLPILFTMAGDGCDRRKLARAVQCNLVVLAVILCATIVSAAAAYGFHKNLYQAITATAYHDASGMLPLQLLAAGLFSTGQVATHFFLLSGQTQLLSAPKQASAVVGIILMIAGAWWNGAWGAAVANAVFGFSYAICMVACAGRFLHVRNIPQIFPALQQGGLR